jgi:glycosyltransferase involved in cell wall biosynthesis
MKPSIALIGSRGIPAKYGGFETFVEHVALALADDGYAVSVSCEGTNPPRPARYKGVELFYFPIKPFRRIFYETLYDVFSLIRASVACDCVIMLGYGAGFFFFIPKVLGKRIIVNVDGREWTREKYNSVEKTALYANERFALLYADAVVADARAIQAYLSSSRGREAVFIPYGVEEPSSVPWDPLRLGERHERGSGFNTVGSGEYYLIVARLERDNHIDMMIEGFLSARTDKKLVVVGNFLDRRYQKEVEALITRDRGGQQVVFMGGIYEKSALNMLRQHCFAYLHGHSAGGTNPSLLEAMIARNLICAHENQYNREVCDRFALFFNDSNDLCACIRLLEAHPEEHDELRNGAYRRAKVAYSWDRVFREYEALISMTLK